ncbi:hypothetical protein AcW1_009459 [Taiwanofungus camphoratus]|nr:hypothetical protein AcV7_006952 [Antrodia cinnamomea]KAI0947787.1 hypothetical protein AcW1_009459 [Antrodia cinnamomea]
MLSTAVVFLTVVAAAAPALALPLDELALYARALHYRRALDELDSLLARDTTNTYSTVPWDRKLRGTVGVPARPPSARSPSPFVIPSGSNIYIPACHQSGVFCGRSLLDELD